MKAFLLTVITFFSFTNLWCQEEEKRLIRPDVLELEISIGGQGGSSATETSISVPPQKATAESSTVVPESGSAESEIPKAVEIVKCCSRADEADIEPDGGSDVDDAKPKEKFHWKPALIQSLAFLAFQHGYRLNQEKTRRELGGPFFRDWGRSVKNLRGWHDADNLATNYIAHPMQGAFTGRIFVNNSDNAKKQEFGESKQYWRSRAKAFVWTAVWSTQFEIGPISEATIGNVGLHKINGYSPMAYADLVVTPVVGTALLIGEDAIDKYLLKNWIEKKSSKFKIRLLRSLLTPTTSLANIIRGKVPWKRDYRPL